MTLVCSFPGCEETINPDRDYQRVRGWTRRRDAGGANQITLREVGSEWACRWCVERARRGINAGQIELTLSSSDPERTEQL
jgi:hypothetical protein